MLCHHGHADVPGGVCSRTRLWDCSNSQAQARQSHAHTCNNLQVLLEAIHDVDVDYSTSGTDREPRNLNSAAGKLKISRRPNYSKAFKAQLVQEALQLPADRRIKPTCARYPGVEPCQLRKWIRLYETNAWRFEQEAQKVFRAKQGHQQVMQTSFMPNEPTARSVHLGSQ
mmetsp:Transcript_27308/g.45537  ORF Transcript_27308/g.45537 Transcript_27308/m.45537 type:complete len:170 (-) Transcript_27308:287-796(-)